MNVIRAAYTVTWYRDTSFFNSKFRTVVHWSIGRSAYRRRFSNFLLRGNVGDTTYFWLLTGSCIRAFSW